VVVNEFDLELADGRALHAYDAGRAGDRVVVVWHHGTPNIGSPPEPLFAAASRLGIRSRMTDPDTVDRALSRAAISRQRRPTWPPSQTLSAYIGSR
jgi:hypothetical protein